MRKLAVFVEGQTEALFFQRLLEVSAAQCSLTTRTTRQTGSTPARRIVMLELCQENGEPTRSISIIDCGNDEQVVSAIRDQYRSLSEAANELIIGVRDVYPNVGVDNVPQLRGRLVSVIPQCPTRVLLVLGVMETEAWFLGEHTHFQKIHPGLTVERIRDELGFDIITDDLQRRPRPCKDLIDAYDLEKCIYDKSAGRVQRTIQALDFENLRRVSKRFPDLESLFTALADFLV